MEVTQQIHTTIKGRDQPKLATGEEDGGTSATDIPGIRDTTRLPVTSHLNLPGVNVNTATLPESTSNTSLEGDQSSPLVKLQDSENPESDHEDLPETRPMRAWYPEHGW